MQTFSIFDIIMNDTNYVENSSTVFMIAQILISSYMQVFFYYKSIKNRDFLQKVFACFIPAWLIVSWCGLLPFTFGSFVNGGIRGMLADNIIAAIQTDRFMGELIVVAIVYVAVIALYIFVNRPKWYHVLLTFGIETVMFAYSLAIIIPLYSGRILWSELGLTTVFMAVYCYFMVIYKNILTVSNLLTMAIFYQSDKLKSYQQKTDLLTEEDCERYAVRFLNQNQKMTAITFAVTIIITESFLTFALLWDSGLSLSLKNILIAYNLIPELLIFLIGVLVWMLYLLVFAFFPKLSKGYRTLKQDGRSFTKFYREVVQNYKTLSTGEELETRNFIVKKNMFFINVVIKSSGQS